MVLMPEPIFATVEAVAPPRPLLLLGPGGRRFDQAYARELAGPDGFTCCAAATRASTNGSARTSSTASSRIGDYVLAGGEVAAMVVLEAVGRLVPGVMGNDASAAEESFGDGLLEYPQYTRPADFRGSPCPTCFARATTTASPDGGEPEPCSGRCTNGPTSSKPEAA